MHKAMNSKPTTTKRPEEVQHNRVSEAKQDWTLFQNSGTSEGHSSNKWENRVSGKARRRLIPYLFIDFCSTGVWLRTHTLSHSTSPFLCWSFWDRVSWNICPGYLWIAILLISASWVIRIIGGSHCHPADYYFLYPSQAGKTSQGTIRFPHPIKCAPEIQRIYQFFRKDWSRKWRGGHLNMSCIT
jgi:hypothetical protein